MLLRETIWEETMTILSRRSILAGTAAGDAATAFKWTTPARALAPVAENQAASFYRYKLGSMEITVLSDGVAKVPVTEALQAGVPGQVPESMIITVLAGAESCARVGPHGNP